MRVSTHKRRGRPVRECAEPLVRTKSLFRGSDGELHVRAVPALPPQNGPHGSYEHIDDALTRKKFTVAELTKAIQARKPQIHERTVRRYLSRKEPLTKEAAVNLILGCWTLGFRLPDDILEEVSAEEVTPRIIVFPGESGPLADILAAKTARLLSLDSRAARGVRELLRGFLERYERLNKTALGREQMDRILQKYSVISPMGRIQIMDREARRLK